MSRILKSIAPYWKSVIIILILLILQANGDLALPQYTSDIIDVGIQNGGIGHSIPEKITKDEYEIAKMFMTDEEISIWESCYEQDGDIYKLTEKNEKKLDEYDDTLAMALIINNQMSSVTATQFREQMAAQMGVDAGTLSNVSVADIGKKIGVELDSFYVDMENSDGDMVPTECVDMRQIFKAMYDRDQMPKDTFISMRDSFKTTFDTMGSSLVSSMGRAYAKSMDAKAGMDMKAIQTRYLWVSGAKMVGIALLIALCTVLVAFFASRVGAGVGRDLRGKVYRNVMSFSNAELDKFSTASLITRTTNDVQQIQMVCVLVLRMVLYAPIIGIGGIIKVMSTGAGMEWVIALAVLVIVGFVLVLMAVAMPKFKKMQKLGFMGIPVPKEYGGQGCDPLTYAMCVEELSKVCGTTGVIVSAHTSLCCDPIQTFGTEEQKQKFLVPLAKGEKLGAFGLTEPGAGTDAQGQQTKAVLDGDEWVLNGSKVFITNGKEADIYVIIAVTGVVEVKGRKKKEISAFIVEKGTPGFTFGTKEKKMGIRGSATYELIFTDCRIPKENLLGQKGKGFHIAMHTLDGGRIGIASQALGLAEGALERTVDYVKERKQFGRAIGQFQNTQFQLADMATKVKAAQLLVYRAAVAKKTQKTYSVEAAMAKLYAAEVAMEVTTKAVQLHGGYGYTREYDVERMMRDAKITEIYEGTSEVQRMVISADLLK